MGKLEQARSWPTSVAIVPGSRTATIQREGGQCEDVCWPFSAGSTLAGSMFTLVTSHQCKNMGRTGKGGSFRVFQSQWEGGWWVSKPQEGGHTRIWHLGSILNPLPRNLALYLTWAN